MRAVLAAALGLALSGCASDYVARTRDVREAYQAYRHEQALGLIEEELQNGPQADRLLALMDKGMILHSAGRYEESIRALAEAEQLADSLEIVSVSEEAETLLSNERHRAYRGEDFERLMISTVQALNYARLGKDEDALVEVRRVNERIRKMIAEEKKPYEQLAIARYLGGVIWEDQGEWDSAFIDYHEALRIEPGLGHLAEPLLRLAKKTGREEAHRELSSRFPGLSHEPIGPEEGQVVVVIEAGLSPQKEPRSTERRRGGELEQLTVPHFRERGGAKAATVRVKERAVEAVRVTSLEEVAKVHLDDRVDRILARQLASIAVKAGVAAGAGALAKNEKVGLLTFWLLNLASQPDLRSWLSLPAEFRLARLRLPAGVHSLAVESGGKVTAQEVEVRAGRIAVVVVRSH
ncbi:MAG: hypothetical protein HYZ28_02635 [Myxococcales bacterium]|nr:hypothetical protein [Myxococcales bacterium]